MTDTIDPLGGSYYLETLTDALEQRVYEYFRKLDELGGWCELSNSVFHSVRSVRRRIALSRSWKEGGHHRWCE